MKPQTLRLHGRDLQEHKKAPDDLRSHSRIPEAEPERVHDGDRRPHGPKVGCKPEAFNPKPSSVGFREGPEAPKL